MLHSTGAIAATGYDVRMRLVLVEADGIKLMHFGDTLWHGYWWKIRARCGPPHVAFLQINGAITQFPNMKPICVCGNIIGLFRAWGTAAC
jgi:hypothetical protein